MKRPVGVTIVSALAFVGGGALLLMSLGYLGFASLQTPLLLGATAGYDSTMLLGSGLITLALGVLSIAMGIGMMSLKRWAWLTGIVVWVSTLVLSAIQLAVNGIAVMPVLAVLISVAILVYLSREQVFGAVGIETPEHFTTHHPSAA